LRQGHGQTLFSYPTDIAGQSEGTQMLITRGTDFKPLVTITAVLIGVAAMLPVQWRASAKRAWSYGVYSVGYRLLSVQLSCGSLAVSGVPFVMKHA
jgi:hypothetical protein